MLEPSFSQHVGAEFQSLTELFHSLRVSVSGNGECTDGHLGGLDGIRLLLHLCTSAQTLLCQQSVMKLADLDSQMRDMVTSADVIRLKTEGADLSRRTYPLPSAAKNRFGGTPDHLSGPKLAYKFSICKTSASAIPRIAAASA